jgi:F-type H+-transporting ATPase subunit delta
MSSSVVADRYARALLELALESNQVQSVAQQLRRAADVYTSSAELRNVLNDPIVDDTKRANIVRAIGDRLGLGALVQNTLSVLVQRRRIGAVGEIADRLLKLADEQAGIVKATVASAQPLTEAQFEAIKQELERLTGCKVSVERRQDPSLLAGIVTRVGDHVIDASLRGRFTELGQKLLENPT